MGILKALRSFGDPGRNGIKLLARLRRAHHSTGDNREDLIRSAELYERVLEQAAPLRRFPWTRITDPRATAYARLGQRDKAIDTALTGIRGAAWTALLQNDAADNDAADVEAALETHSADVVEAARLILDVDPGAVDAAVTAQEYGRSLTMLSTRQSHDAGPRLAAAGRADLAREWDRALRGGLARTPADLRLRVVAVLAGVDVDRGLRLSQAAPVAVERLLAAPTTAEVRDALDALAADALIHLVAGDAELAGFALVVPAREPPVVRPSGTSRAPSVPSRGLRSPAKYAIWTARSSRRTPSKRCRGSATGPSRPRSASSSGISRPRSARSARCRG